jgi:hypothetical protein
VENRAADHHIGIVVGSQSRRILLKIVDLTTIAFVARIALAIGCLAAIALIWPHARDSAAILIAQSDPAALSDAQLRTTARPKPDDVAREIDSALASGDTDLATSFVEVAQSLKVVLPQEVTARVDAAVTESQTPRHLAYQFASGLVTGEVSDAASLTGTVAGDLFVFGDIRDLVREGKHLVTGAQVDHFVLGLACVGLAVTAGTYASLGIATPARAGLTLVKDARRAGRLSAGLGAWAGKSAATLVDRPLLEGAVAEASFLRPTQTARAIKAAVKLDRAGELVTVVKDVGRVGEKAGARAALDVLKVAESPEDVARAARLAAAKGGQTRAIIKILGRGALLLASGTFTLASWLFAALSALFGIVSSIKAMTERLSLVYFHRRRLRRERHRARAIA